ncbi:MAG: pro-sigmaK processing inhibitor BofA family protein, partial [Clostridiales bacterium]
GLNMTLSGIGINLLLALGAFILLLTLSVLPVSFLHLLRRIALNCFCALMALILVNCLAVWSGIALPLNELTLMTGASLGAPGIFVLAIWSFLMI